MGNACPAFNPFFSINCSSLDSSLLVMSIIFSPGRIHECTYVRTCRCTSAANLNSLSSVSAILSLVRASALFIRVSPSMGCNWISPAGKSPLGYNCRMGTVGSGDVCLGCAFPATCGWVGSPAPRAPPFFFFGLFFFFLASPSPPSSSFPSSPSSPSSSLGFSALACVTSALP